MIDRNAQSLRKMLLSRSKLGIKKYGTTTCQSDLSFEQWCQHAIEESLDHAMYLSQAKHESIKQIERKIDLVQYLNKVAKSMPNKVYRELFEKIINL